MFYNRGSSCAYHHTDHLGGTHVETDSSGNLLQYMVYEPYGKIRHNYKSGSYGNDYTFTGKELDSETSLQYFGARYYSGIVGRFTSEDPIFLELGTKDLNKEWLQDPQRWNSYAYSRNNPYRYYDPNGKYWKGFSDWTGYRGVSGYMMKYAEFHGGFQRGVRAIRSHNDAIEAASQKYGVDANLVRAIIYEEQSHLDPSETIGRDQIAYPFTSGGVGLMQVSESVGLDYDYTETELAWDANKNIDAGVHYLSDISERYNTTDPGEIAQHYNGSGDHAVLYGQRVEEQVNNPDYRHSVLE